MDACTWVGIHSVAHELATAMAARLLDLLDT